MFVNRRWRRRLQALLGRGMADDGHSAHPTMITAETPRSPTRAERGRDAIRRRIVRHAIRREAIRHVTTIPHAMFGERRYRMRRAIGDAIRRPTLSHATSPITRDEPCRTRSGTRPYRTRRSFFTPIYLAARICPDMSGYVRICPVMLGDARSLRLPGLFGTVCRDASGPTVRLSRAADGGIMKRQGTTKE